MQNSRKNSGLLLTLICVYIQSLIYTLIDVLCHFVTMCRQCIVYCHSIELALCKLSYSEFR